MLRSVCVKLLAGQVYLSALVIAAPVITSTSLTPSGAAFAAGDAIATVAGTGATVSQGGDFYQISGVDVQLTPAGATRFNSGQAFPLMGLSDSSGEIFLVSKRFDAAQDLSVRHDQVNDSKSILTRRVDGSQSGYAGGYLKFEPSGIAIGTGDQIVSARLNITTDSTGSNVAAGDLGLYQLDYTFPSSPLPTTTWLPGWTEESFNFEDRPYTFAAPLDGGSLQDCFVSSLGSVVIGAAVDEKHSFDISPILDLNGNFTLMLHSEDGNRHYIHSRTADVEATHPYLSVSFITENAITAIADTLAVKEGSSNLQSALQLLENDLLLSPLVDPDAEEGDEEHPIVQSVNNVLFEELAESTHQTFVGGFGYQEVPGNHGTLYLREVGQAFYVHNKSNVTAPVIDTFFYTVEDAGVSSAPATITVTITPDNQAPILEIQEMNFNPAAQVPELATAGAIAATFTTHDADGDVTEVYWLNEDGASPEDSMGNSLYQLNRSAGTVTLTAAGAAFVNTPAELPFIPLALYDSGGKSDFETAYPYVALGDVFYIDNTNGNNTNDGMTLATAFKTDEAVNGRNPQFLNPGATVYVIGSYAHETFDPTFTYRPNVPNDPYIWRNDVTTFRFRLIEGTPGAPITIKGWNENAVIRSDSSGSIVIDDCKHIRVIGLHTEGPSGRMSLETGFDLQFLYRKELADIASGDIFPATNPASDSINGTAVTDAEYAYFYRVPYGSTAEDVEHDYSVPGDLEKINQTQRPVYTDTKGILVRNSQYIDILRNHVEFAASTGIRAQASEFVRIIGNEVNDCSRKASVGTMGMVARDTKDEIAVLGDKSNLYKIIMADNLIHHNFNEIYSWVGGKDFITPELDEGKGLSLEWQEDPSWNQPDSDGRILLMNNVTWLNAVSGVNNHGGDRVDVVGNTSFMNSTYGSLFGLGNKNNIGITHEPDSRGVGEDYGTDVRYWNNLAVTIKGVKGFAIRVNSTSERTPEGFVTYDGGGNLAFGPDFRKLQANVDDGIFLTDADPAFLDPENADFRIPEGSPAQDVAIELTAADDWYIPADVLGLDANRIVRTATANDVGGYEAFAPLTGFSAWVREQVSASTYAMGNGLGPSDDLDGDGIANLMEYALGTLPESSDADANREAQLTVTQDPITGLQTLSYSRPDPARIDVIYEIQESGDLDGWSGTQAADFDATEMMEGAKRRFTWRYDAGSSLPGTSRFYRLMLMRRSELLPKE